MPLSVPRTYAELLRRVKATLFAGQRAIDFAWVQTYHETGRLIHCHVLLKKRADYGAQVIPQLAKDTGASERRLYECKQFYCRFPILRQVAELGWNRGRLLSQVADATERKTLTTQAVKNDWSSTEIMQRVRSLNAASNGADDAIDISSVELLEPKRGTPGLHPIVDRGDGAAVDLGFKLYRSLDTGAARLRPYKAGDIVRFASDGGVRRVDGATKDELFTYAATIRRVVDGDTLAVALTVAPGITLELKLRLRGLDCPEMSTAAGRAAKRFVDELVHAGDEVVISTTKPDKYDRYLADVFLRPAVSDKLKAKSLEPKAEVFLNNALLENGHAVRYDGEGPKAE
jgi:endonuclease YncB( thermonuclease family)